MDADVGAASGVGDQLDLGAPRVVAQAVLGDRSAGAVAGDAQRLSRSSPAIAGPTWAREAKYKAKAAIDSLFVRGGELLSSAHVFAGTLLAMGPRHFAAVNTALVLAWIAIAWAIAREHRKRGGA